jgi:hypothetical protein
MSNNKEMPSVDQETGRSFAAGAGEDPEIFQDQDSDCSLFDAFNKMQLCYS